MKTTLSVIKADIGSIGGHIRPSDELVDKVREMIKEQEGSLIIDSYISTTGDDIAILMTHGRGELDEEIHKLAWDTFVAATEKVAKKQGLYGAGQDLLKDAFSGNVKGMGPAVAELELEERPAEPFIFFAADKTDPGAYNLPLYLAFADPMHCSGLMLSPKMGKGFRFDILDVEYTECNECKNYHTKSDRCEDSLGNKPGNRVITLNAPEEMYDIAALLRDQERFVVESIFSRSSGEQAVAVSTTRLHNIAGVYTGKDDPVALVRVQSEFPATGEILSPYAIGHYVAGFMRGSHTGPLMPSKLGAGISFFDGPPIVTGAAFCVHEGRLTGPEDVFDHAFWDYIRNKVSEKAFGIREQGFFGSAMLPYSELEYGGIVERLEKLNKRFQVKE